MAEETDFFKETTPHVFNVTDLTRCVRDALENALGTVWVEGEICNYRRQSSGHQYFSLKDDRCQISCVLFYKPMLRLRQVQLADGMQVQVRGALTVYEARGQYQINVQVVQPAGAGLLQAKFEALKRKLDAEGLFDAARKKPLPKFPASIALVTSPTGAALRDVLNILDRRASWIRVVIHPVRVQGEGAAQEIAQAITEINADPSLKVDVIVACRGGGSAEDLSQFNDENLARAIFASEIPVVSAVGHEIDFTIADFVADLRAPTPSAAAELVVPDSAELLRHLRACENALSRRIADTMLQWRNRLDFASRGALFRELANVIAGAWQSIDLAEKSIRGAVQSQIAECKEQTQRLRGKLREHRPDQHLQIKRHALDGLADRLRKQTVAHVQTARHTVDRFSALLRVLAPDSTLQRGFSITTDSSGKLIRSVTAVQKGGKILTRLADGTLKSTVE